MADGAASAKGVLVGSHGPPGERSAPAVVLELELLAELVGRWLQQLVLAQGSHPAACLLVSGCCAVGNHRRSHLVVGRWAMSSQPGEHCVVVIVQLGAVHSSSSCVAGRRVARSSWWWAVEQRGRWASCSDAFSLSLTSSATLSCSLELEVLPAQRPQLYTQPKAALGLTRAQLMLTLPVSLETFETHGHAVHASFHASLSNAQHVAASDTYHGRTPCPRRAAAAAQ